jgi:hypothetical protein
MSVTESTAELYQSSGPEKLMDDVQNPESSDTSKRQGLSSAHHRHLSPPSEKGDSTQQFRRKSERKSSLQPSDTLSRISPSMPDMFNSKAKKSAHFLRLKLPKSRIGQSLASAPVGKAAYEYDVPTPPFKIFDTTISGYSRAEEVSEPAIPNSEASQLDLTRE